MENISTIEFVKILNNIRLQNKGKWYMWQGIVNGKTVQIKAYATWLQIFRIDGFIVPTCSDISVSDFKKLLSDNV
jgi:hypothetical protein